MTILVTGSSGHLAEALMRTLRARGARARGADLLSSSVHRLCGHDLRPGLRAPHHARCDCCHACDNIAQASHSARAFVDTNITGTLNLLEAATVAGVRPFVYTSTTSVFGAALRPLPGEPAVWVTEELRPVPSNIYGVTKRAAAELCELFHRRAKLPVLVLRTARFFPEVDDDAAIREHYALANAQANEMLHRRVDLEDLLSAQLLALERASAIGFGRYIICATTPFSPDQAAALRADAPAVVERLFPDCKSIYSPSNWKLFPTIERIYVNALARRELGWTPRYDFRHALECARERRDFRSPLAREAGSKGYPSKAFTGVPYPLG